MDISRVSTFKNPQLFFKAVEAEDALAKPSQLGTLTEGGPLTSLFDTIQQAAPDFLVSTPTRERRAHFSALEEMLRTDFLQGEKERGHGQALVQKVYNSILHQACKNRGISYRDLGRELVVNDAINGDKLLAIRSEMSTIVVVTESNNFPFLPEGVADKGLRHRMGLLFGEKGMTKAVAQFKFVKALSVTEDPETMSLLRNDFQTIFTHLCDLANSEQGRDAGSQRLENLQIFLGNVLAMYPYLQPEEGEEVKVPQKIGNSWQMVTYENHWIPMTDDTMGKPYCALGLRPKSPEGASPQLIFMGTTFPTSRGAFYTYVTDLAPPGKSVSNWIYERDTQENVKRWLEEVTREAGQKAKVMGQSLGGALTLETTLRYPEYLAEARAYAPAALTESTLASGRTKLNNHPDVNIEAYINEGDITPYAGGHYPSGCKIYKFYAPEKYGILYSHLKAFSGQKQYVRIKVAPVGAPRGFLTTLHHALSSFLFPVTYYSLWAAFRLKRLLSRIPSTEN